MVINETGYFVINIIIVLLYLLAIFSSYKKGLIYGLISFAYIFIAIIISWFLTPIVSNKFKLINIEKLYNLIDINPIINYCCWFVIIFIVFLIIYLLLQPLLKSIPDLPVIGLFDRVGGVLFGIVNGTILVIILNLLLTTPLFKNYEDVKNNTFLKYINDATGKIVEVVSDNIDFNNIKDQIKDFDVDAAREAFKLWLEEQGLIENE